MSAFFASLQPKPRGLSLPGTRPEMRLQRKCACGSSSHESECAECKKKKFQCRASGNAPCSAAAPQTESQSHSHSEPRFGHDFSKVRVQSDAEGERLRSVPSRRTAGSAAGSGSIEERITRLKKHNFLCPPTADTLTNISKAAGGGGTLGLTKIDQASNLMCAPKFDIDAKAGTCSFKAVAPSLLLTSKFPSVTPEALTSDSLPVPGCGEKPVPIFGKITQDVSDLAKQGEQEHCDDLTLSFNQTLKPCAAEVNKYAGHVFKGKTEDDLSLIHI